MDGGAHAARRLEPYDQGYRDGWHDVHITRRQRRRRRRLRSAEYALGYTHGRIDGAEWPEYPEWWPDFAQAPSVAHDPASPARLEASDRPGAAGRARVVSGPTRARAMPSRTAVA
jgi:hypothetical protein